MDTPRLKNGLTATALALLVALSVVASAGVAVAASSVTVSQSTTAETVAPGETVTVEAEVSASELNSPALDVGLPDGWTITEQSSTPTALYKDVGGVNQWAWVTAGSPEGVNGSYTATYTVQVPESASPGEYAIDAEGSGINPENSQRLTDATSTAITVAAPDQNEAPTLNSIENQTVVEGGSTSVPLSASDADGDSVSLSVDGPAFVSLSNGALTIAPQSGDAGTYDVTVTASDGQATTTQSFQLTVEQQDTNEAPTLGPIDDQTVTAGTSATVSVNASDADGDDVSLSVDGPEFVSVSNGELTIAPAAGDAGTYDVTVTASDGQATTTQSFQLTVEQQDTNEAPSIEPIDDQTVTAGTSATVSVSASDADGDDVSLSVSGADFVSVSNSELTIAPGAGDAGTYDVTVTASDGQATATQSFQLTVEAAQEEPAPEPVVNGEPPTDPDGDGLYEDVNGNDQVEYDDVVVLFLNLDSEAVQNHGSAYDFNGNGQVEYDDVVELFLGV